MKEDTQRGEVTFVHVGKCAGGTVEDFLHGNGVPFNAVHARPVELGDLRAEVFVALRDPVARVVSSFNWRHPSTQPPAGKPCCPVRDHSAKEERFYSCFDHVNDFAEALDAETDCGRLARGFLQSGGEHVGMGYRFYFPDAVLAALQERKVVVVNTDHLEQGLHAFMARRQQPVTALHLKRSHSDDDAVYPRRGDTYLSERGRARLMKHLKEDYDVYYLLELLADRSEAEPKRTANASREDLAELPPHVWMFWDAGFESADGLRRTCLASWQERSGYTVHALDSASADELIGRRQHYPDAVWETMTPQARSDVIRVEVLAEHGGVWADATTYCGKPLDEWLPAAAAPAGFFAYQFTTSPPPMPRVEGGWTGTVVSSWFMAAPKGSPVARKLRDRVRHEWANLKAPDLRLSYFWLHKIFNDLSEGDTEFAQAVRMMPVRSNQGPHCESYDEEPAVLKLTAKQCSIMRRSLVQETRTAFVQRAADGAESMQWLQAATVSFGNFNELEGAPVRQQKDFEHLAALNADLAPRSLSAAARPQVVLGIFSAPGWAEQRNIHRETWFRSPLVCRGSFGTPEGCAILPQFVVEDEGPVAAEAAEHGDIFFSSGGLAGKQLRWIAAASRAHPAAFVGKMDSDTYVSPANLLADLEPHAGKDVYYGDALDGQRTNDGPNCGELRSPESPGGCDLSTQCCCPPEQCRSSDGFSASCWLYMHGGLYIVSSRVATHIASNLDAHKSYAQDNGYHCEDVIVGKWVQGAALQHPVEAVEGAGTSNTGCDGLGRPGLAWYHMYYGGSKYKYSSC